MAEIGPLEGQTIQSGKCDEAVLPRLETARPPYARRERMDLQASAWDR